MQSIPPQSQPTFFAEFAQETWIKTSYHLMPPGSSALLGSCDRDTLGEFKQVPSDIIALILYFARDDCIVNVNTTNWAFNNVSLSLRFSHRFNADGHVYVQQEVAKGRILQDVLLTCPAAKYRAINYLPMDPEGLHILRTEHGLDAGPALLLTLILNRITLEDARAVVTDYPDRWGRIFDKNNADYPANELASCSYGYVLKNFGTQRDMERCRVRAMDSYKNKNTGAQPSSRALKYIFGGGMCIDLYCDDYDRYETDVFIKPDDTRPGNAQLGYLMDMGIIDVPKERVEFMDPSFSMEFQEKDSDSFRIKSCLKFHGIWRCVNADVISLDDIIRITRTQSAWSLTTHTDPLKKDHSLSNLRYLFLLIDLIFTNKVDVKKEGLIDRLLGDFSRPDVVEFIDKLRSGEILNGGIPFIPDSTLQIVKEGQSSVVRVVEDCQFEVGRAIDAIMSSTNSASEKQKSESCTIF